MHKSALIILILFLASFASCSPSNADTTPAPAATSTQVPTKRSTPASSTVTVTPVFPTATSATALVQLDEAPVQINPPNPYPYPGPEQPVSIAPATPSATETPLPTFPHAPSPSPTLVRSTPDFPESLLSLRVAYIAQGKLWLWSMGESTFLADVDDTSYKVRISSDGNVVAFTRESGLWAINSDGSGERLLIGAEDFVKMEPSGPVELAQLGWVPGTHNLLLTTRVLTEIGIFLSDDLRRVNADTLASTPWLSSGQGGRFAFSPDGKWLSLVTPTEIRVMGIDGSNYRTLLEYPAVAIPSEFEYYAHPVWAPDSRSLLVAIPPQDIYYEPASDFTIWRLPIDGSPAAVVSTLEAETGQMVYISPDLAKIAILYGSLSQQMTLHIASIDDSHDQVYAACDGLFIGWAPDSERFVCQAGNSYQLGQLGFEPVLLTDKASGFAWVGPSNFIFMYGYSGGMEIRLGFIGEPSITLIGPEPGALYYDFMVNDGG